MRIERVRVCGFGTLRDARLVLPPDRAGLIIAPNEAGKSTLLAAIETALYGFESKRTDAGRQMREAFRPWSGGASWVELTIRHDGRVYTIRYDVLDAAGRELERWSVTRDGEDVTDAMQREAGSPGAWLTGLSRDDFARTALVHQGELDAIARDPGRLTQHLERIVSSTTAGGSAEQALRLLDEALEKYRERAGLEALADDVLARARQWTRVQGRLRERIETLRRDRRSLETHRRELEAAIERLQRDQSRIAALRIVRDVLECLHDRAAAAAVRRQLEADQRTRADLSKLDAALAEYADVERFDLSRVDEVAGLFGKHCEQLEQFEKARQAARRLEQELRGLDEQIARHAALDAMLPVRDELVEALALLRRAHDDVGTIREEELRPLERDLADEGLEPDAIGRAYDRLHQLPGDLRRFLREYERNRKAAAALLRNHDEAAAVADERVQAIGRGQRRRRRMAAACAVATVLLAAASVSIGWQQAAPASLLAWIAAGIVAAGGALAGWFTFAARRYGRDELVRAVRRRDEHRSEAQRLRAQQEQDARRLAALAGELNIEPQELLAEAALLEAHQEAAEKLRDVRIRLDVARAAFRQQADRWRQWLRQAGREAPEPLTVEAAEHLLRDLEGLAALHKRREDTRGRFQTQQQELADRRDALHRTRTELARLLREVAGVTLDEEPADPSADGSRPAETIARAEAEFRARLERAGERDTLLRQRRELAAALLEESRRVSLVSRLEQIEATPLPRFETPPDDLPPVPEPLAQDDAGARTRWTAALIDWLRALPAGLAAGPQVSAWRVEALEPQPILDARRRVERELEDLRQQVMQQSQQTRTFLAEYARRMPQIDAELSRLEAELRRGEAFAEAIALATQTLRSVQQRSHERWAAGLSAALRPGLERLLADYELESIGPDLALTLRHRATGTRLDAEGIRRHLSRGAQDRLFLAVRLALVAVLTGDRGPRLPLLLDDVLANCDDARFADALSVLAELARDGWCVLLLTCQRSRAESLMPAAVSALWQRIDDLQVVTAESADLVPPARGRQAAV